MIRELATSQEYRHVPTGTLALRAQRRGKVFASPSTWYRLIREHQWRRPRQRVHPAKPKAGIRIRRIRCETANKARIDTDYAKVAA